MGSSWRRVALNQVLGKKFYCEGSESLEQVVQWIPHPWRCSKAGWDPEKSCSIQSASVHRRGLEQDDLKLHSNPNHPMIL